MSPNRTIPAYLLATSLVLAAIAAPVTAVADPPSFTVTPVLFVPDPDSFPAGYQPTEQILQEDMDNITEAMERIRYWYADALNLDTSFNLRPTVRLDAYGGINDYGIFWNNPENRYTDGIELTNPWGAVLGEVDSRGYGPGTSGSPCVIVIFCKGCGGFAGGAQWHHTFGGGMCMLGDWCIDSLAERVPPQYHTWWTGKNRQTGAAAHEMGHCWGLAHPDAENPQSGDQDYPYTVMGAWWDWPTYPPNPADPGVYSGGFHGWAEDLGPGANRYPGYQDDFMNQYRSAYLTTPLPPDCNDNDLPDSLDIARGTSEDVNGNGVPDECEFEPQDCNQNGTEDGDDITNGTSLDTNFNGIPDECEAGAILRIDFEAGSGYQTGELDGQDGWALAPGKPAGALVLAGDNGPSISGSRAVQVSSSVGSTEYDRLVANFVATAGEIVVFQYDIRFVSYTGTYPDDRSLISMRLYDDSVNGAPTYRFHYDGGGGPGAQIKASSTPDGLTDEWLPDTPIWYDNDWHTCAVIYDYAAQELVGFAFDGLYTETPGWYFYQMGTGLAEATDLIRFDLGSYDNDDAWRIDNITVTAFPLVPTDCNDNGLHDPAEIRMGFAQDCNGNDVPDTCDIDSGASSDNNGNGIPDECEQVYEPGDMNCDGVIDFGDINPFVAALSGQAAYEAAYPDCNWLNADVNSDGTVDFDDINPFVAVLSGK